MKGLYSSEFDDLFMKDKMDFLKNAWKHKLHIMNEL